MMHKIKYSRKFRKDVKKVFNKKQDFQADLDGIIDKIINYKKRTKKVKFHKLHGDFKDCHTCHLKPDLILIYKLNKEKRIIYLLRLGSHSDLF